MLSSDSTKKNIKNDIKVYTPDTQMVEAHNAFEFAESNGTPLNALLTVVFNRTKLWKTHVRDEAEMLAQATKVRQAIKHAISDFCVRHGFPFAAVYAVENCVGRGPHVHYLIHIPEHSFTDLRDKLTRCIAKSMRGGFQSYQRMKAEKDAAPSNEKDRFWLPVHINTTEKHPDKPLTREQALTKLRYLCKSGNPNQPVTYNGNQQTLAETCVSSLKESGDARTRLRMGSTRNLGKEARKNAGFTDDPELTFLLRPGSKTPPSRPFPRSPRPPAGGLIPHPLFPGGSYNEAATGPSEALSGGGLNPGATATG